MSKPRTLITGAGTDIGRSLARGLALSRELILADGDQQDLQAVRAACENTGGHRLWVYDPTEVQQVGCGLVSLLAAQTLGVDHFVHCAQIFEFMPAKTVEMSRVIRLFSVNLFSAVEIIRVLTSRRYNARTLRSISFISSIATRVGVPGYSVYASSKGALNALARSLAVELAPEVRVNTILVGCLEAGHGQPLSGQADFTAAGHNSAVLGPGSPEDVLEAVAFLSSDKARWITGQELVVDGGRSIL